MLNRWRTRATKKYIFISICTCMLLVGGCSTVGYYSQAVTGHFKLMNARQSVDDLLADEQTDPDLKSKLQTLVDAREFAVSELLLPENDSYSTYVETGRRAVTWNVVATPEFSMQPKIWCFPVAGCVSYRGYFDLRQAEHYAADLAENSFDVSVGGASAYSTLGWFDDPILDTMLRGGEIRYVGTLFHELAHQVLYVKDDSNFNEAFASFVEQEGVRLWLAKQDQAADISEYDASLARGRDFGDLLKVTRLNLLKLYSTDLSEAEMRQGKEDVFAQMQTDYEALKVEWGGYKGYDGWFRRGLNNARLVAVATYQRLIPAFSAMYDEAGGSFLLFYTLAKTISELPSEERQRRMSQYLISARS